MPPGGEDEARRFYGRVLGMTEVAKPAELAARGGCWFRAGALELHLGVEDEFRPARKAHPGIDAGSVEALEDLAARLRAAGHDAVPDGLLPGYRRFYVSDPFGNRLEFLAAG